MIIWGHSLYTIHVHVLLITISNKNNLHFDENRFIVVYRLSTKYHNLSRYNQFSNKLLHM